ncbi:MAG: 30S ribosomal protein S8 [Rhodothermales bacterium]|nr:30S ribosomal protein S8 [Rhodothermales bacterium]
MSAITDPVADYLTRVRNAQAAGHKHVDIPASKLKRAITQILQDKGFVERYLNVEDGKQGLLRVYLKYGRNKKGAIKEIKRVSRPGLRRYASAEELPRVKDGLGIAIVSTSQGVMTDKEARRAHVGGEVLAFVY